MYKDWEAMDTRATDSEVFGLFLFFLDLTFYWQLPCCIPRILLAAENVKGIFLI